MTNSPLFLPLVFAASLDSPQEIYYYTTSPSTTLSVRQQNTHRQNLKKRTPASAASSSSSSLTRGSNGCVICSTPPACPVCPSNQVCSLSAQTCDTCPAVSCVDSSSTYINNDGSSSSSSSSSSSTPTAASSAASADKASSTLKTSNSLLAPLIAGITGGVVLVCLAAFLIFYCRRKRKLQHEPKFQSDHNAHEDNIDRDTDYIDAAAAEVANEKHRAVEQMPYGNAGYGTARPDSQVWDPHQLHVENFQYQHQLQEQLQYQNQNQNQSFVPAAVTASASVATAAASPAAPASKDLRQASIKRQSLLSRLSPISVQSKSPPPRPPRPTAGTQFSRQYSDHSNTRRTSLILHNATAATPVSPDVNSKNARPAARTSSLSSIRRGSTQDNQPVTLSLEQQLEYIKEQQILLQREEREEQQRQHQQRQIEQQQLLLQQEQQHHQEQLIQEQAQYQQQQQRQQEQQQQEQRQQQHRKRQLQKRQQKQQQEQEQEQLRQRTRDAYVSNVTSQLNLKPQAYSHSHYYPLQKIESRVSEVSQDSSIRNSPPVSDHDSQNFNVSGLSETESTAATGPRLTASSLNLSAMLAQEAITLSRTGNLSPSMTNILRNIPTYETNLDNKPTPYDEYVQYVQTLAADKSRHSISSSLLHMGQDDGSSVPSPSGTSSRNSISSPHIPRRDSSTRHSHIVPVAYIPGVMSNFSQSSSQQSPLNPEFSPSVSAMNITNASTTSHSQEAYSTQTPITTRTSHNPTTVHNNLSSHETWLNSPTLPRHSATTPTAIQAARMSPNVIQGPGSVSAGDRKQKQKMSYYRDVFAEKETNNESQHSVDNNITTAASRSHVEVSPQSPLSSPISPFQTISYPSTLEPMAIARSNILTSSTAASRSSVVRFPVAVDSPRDDVDNSYQGKSHRSTAKPSEDFDAGNTLDRKRHEER